LLYVSLRIRFGFWAALLISSAIFAVLHSSPATFFTGLFLGYVYEREQDISLSAILHSLINVFVTIMKFHGVPH